MIKQKFALWLMNYWYAGYLGDWARKLSFKIQDELLDEYIKDNTDY